MQIGVGITTTDKRPKHRDFWKTQILFTPLIDCMRFYIADNAESVAKGKNECLRNLQYCDHIFLFDDDTFPHAEGWADIFINASKESGNQHFSYLREVHQTQLIKTVGNIGVYNNSFGCMMYITKEGLEKVGAFDERYTTYGFEHVNYSERCYRAGITGARNVCPIGADDYIYSMDLDAWKKFDFVHHSTLPPDVMHKSVVDNYEIFKNDAEPVIYLPL